MFGKVVMFHMQTKPHWRKNIEEIFINSIRICMDKMDTNKCLHIVINMAIGS